MQFHMHFGSRQILVFPLDEIKNLFIFPPSPWPNFDNQSTPNFIQRTQLQKEVRRMAIIRILMQVRQQQQLGTHYIQSERERRTMERQTQRSDYQNEREEHREEHERENRNDQRRQVRRQIHMLHNPTQQEIDHPVPQDVEPFLSMMELEESNKPSLNNQSLAHLNPTYKTIHPSDLSVRLQHSQQNSTTKQTLYEKILIYGIVWHKDVNGLFDYEEKDKTERSSIVIEDDVRSHINFLEGEEGLMPREDDAFLVVFKTKMKRVIHEKVLLRDVRIAALKRHLPNSKEVNERGQKYNDNEFLCGFKLVMNNLTNQFTIKVYSFEELKKQVKLIRRKGLSEEKKQRKLELKQNVQEAQNNQTLKLQQIKIQPIKQQPNQSLNSLNPLNLSQQSQPLIHQPYFIIRTLSKNSPQQALGYKLYPGDLVKLGKIQYKVISIDGVSIEDRNSEYDRRAVEVTQITQEEQEEIECKYCLGGKSEQENNFFVHLCDCRGHIGYVHYNCLTTWTTTRASIETAENVKMYYLQKMKCQVCTKQFPKYFRYNTKLYHILPIDLPQKHVMLVDVSQKQDASTVVITGVQGNQTIVGRGREAQLRVTDITVSRKHAKITRVGDNYYIKDEKSKFGTLVRSTEKEIETEIEYKKGFQISNVIFTIQIIKREVEKERQAQKESEKVLNSEKIREEKPQYGEENQYHQNKSHQNNSFSTIFKRNSEYDRHPNTSFDFEKLNPQTDYQNKLTSELIKQTQLIKQEIEILSRKHENNYGSKKPVIVEQEDEKVIEEEQQTRTTKRPERRVSGVNGKGYFENKQQIEESTERQQSIKKLLQKRLSERENMHYLQQESDEIELENDQNTRNVNNNAELIPSSSSLHSMKKTKPKRICFEEDEENEHGSH